MNDNALPPDERCKHRNGGKSRHEYIEGKVQMICNFSEWKPPRLNKYMKHKAKHKEAALNILSVEHKFNLVRMKNHMHVSGVDVGFIPHKSNPSIGCSPDGLTTDGKVIIVKCPCSSERKLDMEVNRDIPRHHMLQVQTNMEVMDMDQCVYVVYRPKEKKFSELMWFRLVDRDHTFFTNVALPLALSALDDIRRRVKEHKERESEKRKALNKGCAFSDGHTIGGGTYTIRPVLPSPECDEVKFQIMHHKDPEIAKYEFARAFNDMKKEFTGGKGKLFETELHRRFPSLKALELHVHRFSRTHSNPAGIVEVFRKQRPWNLTMGSRAKSTTCMHLWREFRCHRSRTDRGKNAGNKLRESAITRISSGSKMIGCEARLMIRYHPFTHRADVQVSSVHNHSCEESQLGLMHGKLRKNGLREWMVALMKTGVSNAKIMEKMIGHCFSLKTRRKMRQDPRDDVLDDQSHRLSITMKELQNLRTSLKLDEPRMNTDDVKASQMHYLDNSRPECLGDENPFIYLKYCGQNANEAFSIKNAPGADSFHCKCRVPDGSLGLNDFLMVFQSLDQAHMLRECSSIKTRPNAAYVDGTHSTDQYRYCMTEIIVADESERGRVVMFALSNLSDSSERLWDALWTILCDRMKSIGMIGEEMETMFELLMTDITNGAYKAAVKKFPNIKHRWCKFHCKKAWTEAMMGRRVGDETEAEKKHMQGHQQGKMNVVLKDTSMRELVLNALMDMLEEESLSDMMLKMEGIRTQLHHSNEIAFLRCLDVRYFAPSRLEKWAVALCDPGHTHHTNNFCESFHKQYKHKRLAGVKNRRIEGTMNHWEQEETEQLRKYHHVKRRLSKRAAMETHPKDAHRTSQPAGSRPDVLRLESDEDRAKRLTHAASTSFTTQLSLLQSFAVDGLQKLKNSLMHSVMSNAKDLLRQARECLMAGAALCEKGSQDLTLHCKDECPPAARKPKLIDEILHFKPNKKRGRKPDPGLKRMTGKKMRELGKKMKDIGRVTVEHYQLCGHPVRNDLNMQVPSSQ